MRGRFLALAVYGASLCGAPPPGFRIYISGLQQGDVAVYDGTNQGRLLSVPVRDGGGIVSVVVTSDGQKLLIADDDRLRILAAKTGQVLSEHPYQGAQHVLGGRPFIFLTGDDRFLFIKTYDLGAAAAGVRIFDLASGAFTGVGLRARSCPAPEFVGTRTGALFAVCPHSIQPLNASPTVSGDLSSAQEISLSLPDVVDLALTPRGDQLFVLESLKAGDPWRLVTWTVGQEKVRVYDLRTLLDLGPNPERAGRQAWIAVSPDAKHLAVLHGTSVWLFATETLQPEHTWSLDKGSGLQFTPDGQHLLTLDDAGLQLVRLPVPGGEPQRIPLQGLKLSRGPKTFTVASAP